MTLVDTLDAITGPNTAMIHAGRCKKKNNATNLSRGNTEQRRLNLSPVFVYLSCCLPPAFLKIPTEQSVYVTDITARLMYSSTTGVA